MRRKLSLLLMVLLFFTGFTKATELTVYNGTATNSAFPFYAYNCDYTTTTLSQWIVPASAITAMNGSNIQSVTFYLSQKADGSTNTNWQLYVMETTATTFTGAMDYSSATKVYEGAIDLTKNTLTITFSTPFAYHGGNLLFCGRNMAKGSYKGASYYGENGHNNASYYSYQYGSGAQNFLPKTTFTFIAPPPELVVEPLDFGYRPNNAWMEPVEVAVSSTSTPLNITAMDMDNDYFTVGEVVVPFTTPKNLTVATGSEEEGEVTGNLSFMYGDAKSFKSFEITANAYNPVDGDVWEKATAVTGLVDSTQYAYVPDFENIYHNYNLPGEGENGKDAAYKLTFPYDVLLNVGVSEVGHIGTAAENAKAALYTEDFNGEGGPMATNNYKYNGPIAGRGTRASDLINEGFEGGSIPTGWSTTSNKYSVAASKGGKNACTGSYSLFLYDQSDYSMQAYDIKFPTVDLTEATGGTLSFNIVNPTGGWGIANAVYLYVSLDGGAATLVETISYNTLAIANWTQKSYDLTNYLGHTVQFKFTINNFVGVTGIDDVKLSADLGPEDPEYIIENMFVPAGTYYLAAAATDEFQVNVMSAAAPAPEAAVVNYPTDGMTGVESPCNASWTLKDYTTEMQVKLGTTYPPAVLIDWTSDLVAGTTFEELLSNTTYFMQVNVRNAAGTTEGDIIGFTTVLDVPTVEVATENLYPGDAAQLTWTLERSFRGYNVYADGEKVNEELVTEDSYAVEGLEHGEHTLNVTAVYDEGESEYSDDVTVTMTGFGHVAGAVYEMDATTPIEGAEVYFEGTDAFGEEQTFVFTTDATGAFTGDVLEGEYIGYAGLDGYQITDGRDFNVVYDNTIEDIMFYLREEFKPLGQVYSEVTEDDQANIWWDWTPAMLVEDFEHNGEMPEGWSQVGDYGFELCTTDPYEGTYCIKSTNVGVNSSTAAIEVTVNVPYEAKMSFYIKPSSESGWDKGYFYIDGVEKYNTSGTASWTRKEYTVEQGVHTYKWAYTKDSSLGSNDDCVYVDYVTLYEKVQPTPPVPGGVTYDFEDGFQGWTSIDADGDGYGWKLGTEYMTAPVGHESNDCVFSQSYDNGYGALNPNNFLVSPSKLACQAGAMVSFWACAQDAGYSAEHFGVAVSTAGNTSASDFTTIAEWTFGSKGASAFASANGKAAVRGTRAQSEWVQYAVDLSAYAGQEIWVALRHFNCTDMFYIDVDDITLADGSAKATATNTRSFQYYKVYRKNILAGDTTLVASTSDTTYLDTEWTDLADGMYQYGVSAIYDGNRGNRTTTVLTEGFESGIPSTWSQEGSGMQWYTNSEYATPEGSYAARVDCDWSGSSSKYLITPALDLSDATTAKVAFKAHQHMQAWKGNTPQYGPDPISIYYRTSSTASWTLIQTVAEGNSTYGNYNSHEITIPAGAFVGTAQIAFRNGYDDGYGSFIDNIVITKENTIIPPTGEGESEITWADPMDKNMVALVELTAVTNNGQSAEGTMVSFTNNVEDYVYEATLDETGYISFPEFRKGYYTVSVELEGYTANIGGEVEIFEDMTFDVLLSEVIYPANDLYVSPTGWVMWENAAGEAPVPVQGDEFTESWDSGLNGWTNIDADGDGHAWYHSSEASSHSTLAVTSHTGAGHLMGESYCNYYGALTPNDFLVTPQKYAIADGSEFSFYACAQDVNYAAEHFGVAISTTGNTSAADFTTIAEWTLTSKGGVKGPRATEGTREGSWYQYTADLSSYAGQEVWIAIRHFNCTDEYLMNIDDAALTVVSKNREALYSIVMLDGIEAGHATSNYFQLDESALVEGEEYGVAVASVYATGMSGWKTTTFTYSSCDNFKPGVKNLAGEAEGGNVTLTWTLPGGGGAGDEFTFGFDNDLEGWTNIDADGDGHMWYHSNEAGNHSTLAITSHTGAGHVMGESYCNASYAALTPNDFLVSPQQYNIGGSSVLTFWACAQDASYAAEHFGVAISTTGNTSAADFTTVAEWTLTAKSGYTGPRAADGTREGTWYQYTCDLSEYAGQAWIAIRHFNCSDQFLMCLDDVMMYNAEKSTREGNWYGYDNGAANEDAIGTGGGEFWWGIMLPAGSYEGNVLSAVSAYDYMAMNGDAAIYQGGTSAPEGEALGQVSVSFTGAAVFTEFTFETPITLDPEQNVWVIFHNASAATYPAAVCANSGDANGRWVSLDGSSWADLASYGLDYTFQVRAYIEEGETPIEGDFLGAMIFRDGELITPQPLMAQQMVDMNVADGEHEYMARLAFGNPELGVLDTVWYAMSCPVYATVTVENACTPVNNLQGDYEFGTDGTCTVELTWACADATVETFKVYRDGVYVGETTNMTYTDDRTNQVGSYEYGVVAVYANCESEMVTVTVTITSVEGSEVVEGIYPNPTTGKLNIKAAAMQQVTVANALGQVVLVKEVSGNETIIDMSTYEAGVYMVRVATENGTSVKRISVIK